MVEDALHVLLANNPGLSSVVDTRVYPGRAPQSASFPFVTYTRLGSEHIQVLAGSAGFNRALFQIDTWSTSYLVARDLGEKIRRALQGYSGTIAATVIDSITIQEDRDRYIQPSKADELGIHSASMDFYIWHEEVVPTFS